MRICAQECKRDVACQIKTETHVSRDKTRPRRYKTRLETVSRPRLHPWHLIQFCIDFCAQFHKLNYLLAYNPTGFPYKINVINHEDNSLMQPPCSHTLSQLSQHIGQFWTHCGLVSFKLNWNNKSNNEFETLYFGACFNIPSSNRLSLNNCFSEELHY